MKRNMIIVCLALVVCMVGYGSMTFASESLVEHEHQWTEVIEKASFDRSGCIRTSCVLCGEIEEEKYIPSVYFVDVENDYSEYKGEKINPNVKLKLDDFTYLSEKLYDVETLSDFTNAGVHSYKVTLKGTHYEGTRTEEFNILKSGITGIETRNKQLVYNGKSHTIYPIKGIPKGSTVYYSLLSGPMEDPEFKKTLSTEIPYFTDAGSYMVNFYIEHENYEYYQGYTWLTIEPYTGPFTFKYSFTKTPYTGKQQVPKLTVEDKYGNTYVAKVKCVTDGDGISPGIHHAHYDLGVNYAYGEIKPYYIVPKKSSSFTADLRAGYNCVTLKWKKCKGADGYRVYYKKASESKYRDLIFGAENPSITIPSRFLSDGTKFTFKLVPYVEAEGKSVYLESQTSKVSITTLKKIATPTVARTTKNKIKLSWKNIAGETGYQISKSKTKAGIKVYKTYKTVSDAKISKTLTIKKTKTSYYYRVRAYKTIKVGDEYKKVYAPWSNPIMCK